MNMHTLNVWAIVVAAVSAFAVGGLWYSPFVFGKAGQRTSGFVQPEDPQTLKVFGLSFVFSSVMSFNLAMF